MKNLEIPYSFFKNLCENDRSIINLRKIIDSSIRFNYNRHLDENAVILSREEFNRTYGQVSDGTKINIGTDEPYFKIITDLILDEKQHGVVLDLVNIARKEYPVFRIYINGLKIPDEVVKMYCSASYTDIFVPLSLVNKFKTMDVVVESINFSGNEYINQYYPYTVSSSVFTVDLKRTEADNIEDIKKECLLIFNNGLLIHNDYTITNNKDRNNFVVSLDSTLSGSVEIVYDASIKYRKNIIETKDVVKKLNFYIDDGFIDPLFGSIPKKAISFYVNGKKSSNTDIKQIGRTHYTQSFDPVISLTYYNLIIRDFGILDDRIFTVLGSDYYLHKMIGAKRLNTMLETGSSGSGLDGFGIDANETMNQNGEIYDERAIDIRYDYLHGNLKDNDDTVEERIKYEVRKNPYILRTFFKNYCKKTRYLRIKNNGKPVRFTTDTKLSDTQEVYFNLFLNRKFLSHNKYTIDNDNLVTIPNEELLEGSNILEIEEIVIDDKNKGIRYINYEYSDLTNVYETKDKGLYEADMVINKESLNGWFEQLSDLLVLEKVSNNSNYLYPSERNIGFIKMQDVDITEEEDTITLHFKSLPPQHFILYFKNFAYLATIINKTSDSSTGNYKNNLVFMYEHSKENPIPIIAKSVPDVYVNGELFIPNIDYVYSTPENNVKVAGSLISFIRRIEKDDVISIIFSEIENRNMVASASIDYKSKYGLLYLGSLPFPFHTSYCDLFIDGKKVFVSDIDLLSDKLIRVNHISVPFNDIFVKTRFSVDYSLLEPYMEEYSSEGFEDKIGNIFKLVDFTRSNSNPGGIVDEVYESFEDNIGQTGNPAKEPNPETPEEEETAIERSSMFITMFATWFVGPDARSMADCNQYINKEVLDYFSLYDLRDESEKNRDVIINSGKREINGYNIIANSNVTPLTDATKVKMIIDALLETGKTITNNTIISEYLKNPISNIIIPPDFPLTKKKRVKKYWLFENNEESVYCWKNQEIFKYDPEKIKDLFPSKYKYKGGK